MLAPNDLVPQSYGISSARIRLRRRISAGSRPSRAAPSVHQPLADEVALGAAGRAQRARRRLVGDDRPEIAGVVRHAIGAGQERGAELGGHERGGAHVGADVGAHERAHAEDAAVARRSRSRPRTSTSRAWLVAMRFSRRSSIHRTGRPSFIAASGTRMSSGIQLAAHAEAAADVDLRQPQRADGDAEDRRQDRAVDVDALGGADQVQLAPARVGRHGHEPARLQRGGRLPRVVEALADDDARRRPARCRRRRRAW